MNIRTAAMANSVELVQTGSRVAVWSGSLLVVFQLSVSWFRLRIRVKQNKIRVKQNKIRVKQNKKTNMFFGQSSMFYHKTLIVSSKLSDWG